MRSNVSGRVKQASPTSYTYFNSKDKQNSPCKRENCQQIRKQILRARVTLANITHVFGGFAHQPRIAKNPQQSVIAGGYVTNSDSDNTAGLRDKFTATSSVNQANTTMHNNVTVTGTKKWIPPINNDTPIAPIGHIINRIPKIDYIEPIESYDHQQYSQFSHFSHLGHGHHNHHDRHDRDEKDDDDSDDQDEKRTIA